MCLDYCKWQKSSTASDRYILFIVQSPADGVGGGAGGLTSDCTCDS